MNFEYDKYLDGHFDVKVCKTAREFFSTVEEASALQYNLKNNNYSPYDGVFEDQFLFIEYKDGSTYSLGSNRTMFKKLNVARAHYSDEYCDIVYNYNVVTYYDENGDPCLEVE